MIAEITGFVTSVNIGPKKFNGKLQTDADGQTIIDRKFTIVDVEDEKNDTPMRVNFSEDQQEEVEQLAKSVIFARLQVGRMNKYTFYRLLSIEAVS